MLPQILLGSYKRYKEDTNVFTTWLSQSAKACGYKLPDLQPDDVLQSKKQLILNQNPQPSSTRLKGKARKEAKKAGDKTDLPQDNRERDSAPVKKYLVATKDILDQAETVARSVKPRIQVPVQILQIVQRSIDARERCQKWFQKTGVKNETSTEGHAHFINVLEKALAILKPCCAPLSHDKSKAAAVPQDAKTQMSTDEVDGRRMKNQFHGLQVEDTDDRLDIAASDIIAVPNKSTAKKPASRDVYELELGIDLAFIIFCLFEDLHRMQDFVKTIWRKVNTGGLNITTASILTDFAIYLARRAEEDVVASAPELPAGAQSYEVLSFQIFYADSFSRGEDPIAKLNSTESLRITPFDDFIYLSTARTLMKFASMAKFKISYPQPVLPARFSYISRPELLELPEIKKWEAEDEFLSQMLMDLSFNDNIAKALKETTKQEAPILDHLSKAFAEVREKGEVAVWTVFASRILLDIHEILGDRVGRGYQELQNAATLAEKTLDLKTEGTTLVPGGAGERWLTKDAGLVMELNTMIQYYILKYPIAELKRRWMLEHGQDDNQFRSFKELPPEWQGQVAEHMRAKGHDMDSEIDPIYEENAKKIGIRKIEPAKAFDFMLTHNPVYCGMLAFNLAVHMEEAGITLANHHLTIFAFSHLYNALQQLNRVKEKWTEMDEVMKVHTGILFCGQLPTTPKEFHTRFALRMGFPATAFARNQRAASQFRLGKVGPRFASSPTSTIFRHYFDRKGPMEKYLYQLERLFQETDQPQKSRMTSRNFLTPLEMLSQMSDWLSGNLTDMNIDYITLTRTCNKLLKRVRKHINEKLGSMYEESKGEDSNDPVNIIIVFLMLKEASELHFMIEAVGLNAVHLSGSPQLEIAAEVIQSFLRKR